MITELRNAYEDTLWMLEDALRKIPDTHWRQGPDDFLIPARLAYHLMKGFEWLTNDLPREEFLSNRKYTLDWLGPVTAMPDRAQLLSDLPQIHENILGWLSTLGPSAPTAQERVQSALYHLRHTQHHLGELSILAHLLHYDPPEWK